MNTAELSSSLRSVVSALHKGLRKQMSSVNSFSMTEIELIKLLIRNESLLPTELAAYTKITTQSMSQILKKMEGQGIIQKTPSEVDKRKVFISLTDSGKNIVSKTRYDRDEWLKNQIDKLLTESEKGLIMSVLPVLNKLVELE